MAYEKLGFVDKVTPLDARHMNHIEDGIAAADVAAANAAAKAENVEKMIPQDVVKSVNGKQPDENGNVEIDIPEGFSGEWDDLKGKPFGEEKHVIEWDGVLDGHYVFSTDMQQFVHVSDEVVNADDIVGGTVTWLSPATNEMESITITDSGEGTISRREDGFWSFSEVVCYIPTDNYAIASGTLERQGLYFVHAPEFGTVRSIEYTHVTPLSTEFLPSTVPVIPTATAGQAIVVKAVDADGKPTEWEAADMFMLTSPNGTEYKITVSDDGTLSATAAT